VNALALVDCNNFFVSCERVFRPELAGRPVVVLSSNDGCVISRSAEAKQLGVPMGAPFFQIRALAAEHRVVVISGNHELYGDFSRRVMQVLASFSPEMEIYSIDEAFLSLPNGPGILKEVWRLREQVRRWTGIPVSVGLAPTKVLAKLAAERAKTAGGVFSLLDAEERDRALKESAVTDIWGIAKRLGERLASHGVRSAAQLCSLPDRTILQIMGIGGLRLARELRGEPCLAIESCPAPNKSITCSRSFGAPVGEEACLLAAVASFTTQAAARMRRQGLRAAGLTVWTQWRQDGELLGDSRALDIEPSSDTRLLVGRAKALTEEMFSPARLYKKAGVTLLGLEPDLAPQRELFEDPGTEKARRLMKTVDVLNGAFGAGTLQPAATLAKGWRPSSKQKSPCWTTRWQDLPAVKA